MLYSSEFLLSKFFYVIMKNVDTLYNKIKMQNVICVTTANTFQHFESAAFKIEGNDGIIKPILT